MNNRGLLARAKMPAAYPFRPPTALNTHVVVCARETEHERDTEHARDTEHRLQTSYGKQYPHVTHLTECKKRL